MFIFFIGQQTEHKDFYFCPGGFMAQETAGKDLALVENKSCLGRNKLLQIFKMTVDDLIIRDIINKKF